MDLPTHEPEFIKCYSCFYIFKALWPLDAASTLRPNCQRCNSAEVAPVGDATEFELCEAN